MLSSKQRAALRSEANSAEIVLHIGKGGVTEAGVNALRCSGIGTSMEYCFSSALRRIKELNPAK